MIDNENCNLINPGSESEGHDRQSVVDGEKALSKSF